MLRWLPEHEESGTQSLSAGGGRKKYFYFKIAWTITVTTPPKFMRLYATIILVRTEKINSHLKTVSGKDSHLPNCK